MQDKVVFTSLGSHSFRHIKEEQIAGFPWVGLHTTRRKTVQRPNYSDFLGNDTYIVSIAALKTCSENPMAPNSSIKPCYSFYSIWVSKSYSPPHTKKKKILFNSVKHSLQPHKHFSKNFGDLHVIKMKSSRLRLKQDYCGSGSIL